MDLNFQKISLPSYHIVFRLCITIEFIISLFVHGIAYLSSLGLVQTSHHIIIMARKLMMLFINGRLISITGIDILKSSNVLLIQNIPSHTPRVTLVPSSLSIKFFLQFLHFLLNFFCFLDQTLFFSFLLPCEALNPNSISTSLPSFHQTLISIAQIYNKIVILIPNHVLLDSNLSLKTKGWILFNEFLFLLEI